MAEDASWDVTYVLYDHAGRMIACRLCNQTDRWVVEGDGSVFVCEHEPIPLIRGAIRQVCTVRAKEVAAFEFVGLKHAPAPSTALPPWHGAV